MAVTTASVTATNLRTGRCDCISVPLRPGVLPPVVPRTLPVAPGPDHDCGAGPRRGHAHPVAADPADPPPSLTTARLLTRGLTKRCPVCGSRRLFHHWFTMAENCPRCGLRFERIEGHWIGALGINTIVTFGSVLVAVIAAFAATYPDGSVALAVTAVVAVAIVVPLLFYPVSKTLWGAIDLAMRPLEPDDEVDPRWLPRSTRRES